MSEVKRAMRAIGANARIYLEALLTAVGNLGVGRTGYSSRRYI